MIFDCTEAVDYPFREVQQELVDCQFEQNSTSIAEYVTRAAPAASHDTELPTYHEIDIAFEIGESIFPVDADSSISLTAPEDDPILLFQGPTLGSLTIPDWELTIPAGEDLIQWIGRRFLELYSLAIRGELKGSEADVWDRICDQCDYESFAASRVLPRYFEARVIQHQPVFRIEYAGGHVEKLSRDLANTLPTLRKGDYFGAYFDHHSDQSVARICNVQFLNDPREDS